MNKVSAIILAAGSGSRFGEKKQFKELNGKPIWFYSLNTFIQSESVDELILVIPNDSLETLKQSQVFKSLNKTNNIKLVSGGESRKDSVFNGLKVVKKAIDIVCIHDAARPFIKASYIKHSVEACSEFDGAIIAIPSVDTVKKVDKQIIKNTIDRESLWMAQTPQTFKKDKLLYAIKNSSHLNITDESMLMEEANFKIKLIEGDQSNFKITNEIDWELAKVMVEVE
ncbi:MAG: 2-C-methyl-D-erythritol 4-phosphate cytidylyltransferase [bacterium]